MCIYVYIYIYIYIYILPQAEDAGYKDLVATLERQAGRRQGGRPLSAVLHYVIIISSSSTTTTTTSTTTTTTTSYYYNCYYNCYYNYYYCNLVQLRQTSNYSCFSQRGLRGTLELCLGLALPSP